MIKNELEQELIKLCDAGFIEKNQLQNIQMNYKDDSEASAMKSKSVLIFGLLGVVFAGAGVISLFAFNWTAFSMQMQTIISFIPLISIQALLFFKVRSNASALWVELLCLCVGIALTAAFVLIYNTYQLDYPQNLVALIIVIILSPLAYYLKSYYLVIGIFASFLFYALFQSSSLFNYSVLSLIIFLPFYISKRKKAHNVTILSFLISAWVICMPVFLELEYSAITMLFFTFVFALVPFDKQVRYVARIIVYSILLLHAYFSDHLFDFHHVTFNISLCFAIVLSILVYIYAYWKRKCFSLAKLDFFVLSFFLFMISLEICLSNLFSIGDSVLVVFTILYKALIIILSVFKIMHGLKYALPSQVTRYLFAISIYLLGEATQSNLSLLTKGIFFILIGVAFFVVNYILSKRIQNEA